MQIDLPQPYRAQEIWAFHARDSQALAEEVVPGRIRKGLMLQGVPTILTIHIEGTQAHVESDPAIDPGQLEEIARRMLGLTIDPVPFENAMAQDPQLGPLIQARPGLRIAQTATPFEALSWAVIGQQVNLNFALAMRRTFIIKGNCRHSTGLWCYPCVSAAARIDPASLQAQKYSSAKANTLAQLARQIDNGRLLLDDPELPQQLLAVKGVGPWTVQYMQLRGYGHPDCSLHGDSAVRKAMERAFGRELDALQAEQLLERYKPYRSLAAAHFWASLAPQE